MWTVTLPGRVEKELSQADADLQPLLEEALNDLQHNPRPTGCKKLKEALQCWRIRIGSYRILYDIHERERQVVVLKIGPRKDVYRFHR